MNADETTFSALSNAIWRGCRSRAHRLQGTARVDGAVVSAGASDFLFDYRLPDVFGNGDLQQMCETLEAQLAAADPAARPTRRTHRLLHERRQTRRSTLALTIGTPRTRDAPRGVGPAHPRRRLLGIG